ncbi:hypothetical protein ACE939_05065 [Aquimarina sp. W85]|uniref:hypothetical protein n=1 Tax=Aquimarina rhodophyticola TaxID=3342246 RepID=UPI00367247DD
MNYYHMSNFAVEGVGKTTSLSRSGIAEKIQYNYFVDGKKYKGSTFLNGNCGECKLSKYYRIKYSSKDPDYSEMYLDQEVINERLIIKAGFTIDNID